MLQGKDTKIAVPYIVSGDRNSDIPTIFWLKPKNLLGNYKGSTLYQKAITQGPRGTTTTDANKIYDADITNFLDRCEKVENFEFSKQYPEYQKQGVIGTIDTKEQLIALMYDTDPIALQEVMNAPSDWAMLKEGENAYSSYIERKRQKDINK
jgi:hypothetical protein